MFVFDKNFSIFPLTIPKENKEKHIRLLYFKDNKNNKNFHYCWFKGLWKLLGKQITKDAHKRFSREGYLAKHFKSEELLRKYEQFCGLYSAANIILPKEWNKILDFINHKDFLRILFSIIPDFKLVLRQIRICQPDPGRSYSNVYEGHNPHSFTCYVESTLDSYESKPVEYIGDDLAVYL